MKFRFYRVSMMDGEVTGTDDEELAKEYAESEDDFVIDTETGKWLLADGEESQEITEFKRHEASGEGDT